MGVVHCTCSMGAGLERAHFPDWTDLTGTSRLERGVTSRATEVTEKFFPLPGNGLRYCLKVGVAGENQANPVSASWRGGAEEAIHEILVGSGCGQEVPGNIMRV